MIKTEGRTSQAKMKTDDYAGKYVATPSFNDRTVIAVGKSWATVQTEARRKGVQQPVVIYVSARDSVGHF
jgi:hypothetical protein